MCEEWLPYEEVSQHICECGRYIKMVGLGKCTLENHTPLPPLAPALAPSRFCLPVRRCTPGHLHLSFPRGWGPAKMDAPQCTPSQCEAARYVPYLLAAAWNFRPPNTILFWLADDSLLHAHPHARLCEHKKLTIEGRRRPHCGRFPWTGPMGSVAKPRPVPLAGTFPSPSASICFRFSLSLGLDASSMRKAQ